MFGCHLPLNRFEEVKSYGGKSVQIFLTSPKRFERKEFNTKDMKQIVEQIICSEVKVVAIHSSYLINFSRPLDETSKGIKSILQDLHDAQRMNDLLGGKCVVVGVVLHLGKGLKLSVQDATKNYITNLTCCFQLMQERNISIPILVETSAGQGTEIGSKLSDLIELIRDIPSNFKSLVGVTLDTCHIWAAGEYNLADIHQTSAYLNEVHKALPVKLIHVNDSVHEFGSRKDRHESLGKGAIWNSNYNTLALWVKYAETNHIPIILETPNENMYEFEIQLLYQLSDNTTTKQKNQPTKPTTKHETNENIFKGLEMMAEYENSLGNKFKVKAYQNAIEQLILSNKVIKTIDDVTSIRGIGKGIRDKISEILESGTISKLKDIKDDPERVAVSKLTKVGHIGVSKAKELYRMGIRTITELRREYKKNETLLTPAQWLSLKYHKRLEERIPRDTIGKFEEYLNRYITRCVAVGSYRRGKPDSGDVDLLIPPTETISHDEILVKIQKLKSQKKIALRGVLSKGTKKMMCFIEWLEDKQLMHVDFLIVRDEQEYPTMLLYFTGSKENNVRMRQKALDLGYKLSEHGLFDEKGNRIEIKTEEDVYLLLNLTPLKPSER